MFRIASLTKTFTSTLVMQLVEQGKLNAQSHSSRLTPGFFHIFQNMMLMNYF
ncbi:serine hydrolase [Puia sp.]|uniref:serine hydrolase n=1 Tax=Puia sp. TaxID=2045100 RepID=UPI0039C909D2